LYGLTEEEIRIVEGVEKQNNEDFDEISRNDPMPLR